MDLSNFKWGWMDINEIGLSHKIQITNETFELKLYEKLFEVEEGDIVLDIGASVGSFTYSILDKKPKHVFAFEPSAVEFPTLVANTIGYPVTQINKGIADTNTLVQNEYVYDNERAMEGITFSRFIKLYGIEKIDFLKTDCEGGEYSIFTEENMPYILNNVKKIVGEWHLSNPELKEKFKYFRDNYLTRFVNVEVFSINGVSITWNLYNDHFIDYYTEVIVYIYNK
jgi:FkbM family methyltransferase